MTPFVQAHTCRSHDFYYKLALVPVFTEPTFVLSTTSSKVNTAPLAIITAQVWHQNHSDSGSCCKICQSESFTSQALQVPSPKVQQAGPDPCKIPFLFCIPLNHHLATSKAGKRHQPRLLRDHSGGEPEQQQDHYLGRNWKEEIKKNHQHFWAGTSPVLGRLDTCTDSSQSSL